MGKTQAEVPGLNQGFKDLNPDLSHFEQLFKLLPIVKPRMHMTKEIQLNI